MAKLTDRYASYLMAGAMEHGQLEAIYRHALDMVEHGKAYDADGAPEWFKEFVQFVPAANVRPALKIFLRSAQKRLGLTSIGVVSATALTQAQEQAVMQQLHRDFGDKISVTLSVDASLLGGLRIVAGDRVIDNSIKKRLSDMKNNIYKGVYFNQC